MTKELQRILSRARDFSKRTGAFSYIAESLSKQHSAKSLGGVFLAVKDSICVEGMPATASSKILEGYAPPFTATSVSRAREAGAMVIGKAIMDEFGFGSFCTNTGLGISPPKNPLDLHRVCGGSSGGCAAAVSGLGISAIAESTGGSITCPASFCGVVGITPTYGRVSRWGLIDYTSSLDKIGTMAKTVAQASLLLQEIQGHDEKDQSCSKQPLFHAAPPVDKARIGIPVSLVDYCDEKVQEEFWRGVDELESEGFEMFKIELPLAAVAVQAYYILAMAEASTNLAKFCGLRYGSQSEIKGDFAQYFSKTRGEYFGREAKRRILLGSFVRTAGYRGKYYWKALAIRAALAKQMQHALSGCDALLWPSMPITAPKFSDVTKLSPEQHYATDFCTVPPDFVGMPHATIPFGSVDGMPTGLQFTTGFFEESKLVSIAQRAEELLK